MFDTDFEMPWKLILSEDTAAAKAGHRTKQMHFWNCWIHGCASVHALAQSVASDPEKWGVLTRPVCCRLPWSLQGCVWSVCDTQQEPVCLTPNSPLTAGSFRDGPRLGSRCISHWNNKHLTIFVGIEYYLLFICFDDESLQPARRILEKRKNGDGCSAVAELLLPFSAHSIVSLALHCHRAELLLFLWEWQIMLGWRHRVTNRFLLNSKPSAQILFHACS